MSFLIHSTCPTLAANTSIETALTTVSPEGMALVADLASNLGQGLNITPVVFGRDLWRMNSMGLAHLPIEAITCLQPPPTILAELLAHSSQAVGNQDTTAQSGQTEMGGKVVAQSVSRQLCDLFPRKFATALYELQSLFRSHQVKGYLIGGIARDLLRAEGCTSVGGGSGTGTGGSQDTMTVEDVDITLEGNAIDIARLVAQCSNNFELVDSYQAFGTAKLVYKGSVFLDFASTRRESYPYCGALPRIEEQGVALWVDLIRRDFTMNTLALPVHQLGEVLDYTGGVADVQAGLLRVLHGASFFEDPTRILRAYKFATRFGCAIELNTQQWMQQFIHHADRAQYKGGGARIRTALQAWLGMPESANKHHWVGHWLGSGGWRLVMPSQAHCPPVLAAQTQQQLSLFWFHWLALEETIRYLRQRQRSHKQTEDDHKQVMPDWLWWLYVCLLLRGLCDREAGPGALVLAETRLELNRTERDMVADFIELEAKQVLQRLSPNTSAIELVDLLEPHALPAVLADMALQPRTAELLKYLIYYQTQLKDRVNELKGDDLIALGVPANKGLGQMLQRLRHQRLQGTITTRQDEIQFVQAYLKDPTLPFHPSDSLD
jgi:Poly A polymerase head domain